MSHTRGSSTLPAPPADSQLSRYRQLAEHVVSVRRTAGEVRVSFASTVPDGLLARTLETERRCCQFVHVAYNGNTRVLEITVDTVQQAPRLDSLGYLLQPTPLAELPPGGHVIW
jgi:hypothetical protein